MSMLIGLLLGGEVTPRVPACVFYRILLVRGVCPMTVRRGSRLARACDLIF